MVERFTHRLANSILFWSIIVTWLALYLSSSARIYLDFGQDIVEWQVALPWSIYFIVSIIWTISLLLFYPQRSVFVGTLSETLGRLVASISISSLTFAGVLYLSFRDVSRLQFIYFLVADFVLLVILYTCIRSYLVYSRKTFIYRRILLVGTTSQGIQVAREFVRYPWAGFQVVGYMGDKVVLEDDIPHLGSIDDTVHVVAKHNIDEIVFAMLPQERERVMQISLELQQQPVMLHMVPDVIDMAFVRTPVQILGGIPVISLRESALTEPQRMLKRTFDFVASLLLLCLLSPIFFIIAILIKLESPGPIFFLQERIGQHGQRFKMIKFRSMYEDAEKRWKEVAHRDSEGRLIHKTINDPRITRVGQKLRRTSLDELPQLINVLKGEMSLVGPRPEMPYIVEEYEAWQWQRFRVPPGITGWWQVNGRSDRPMHLNTDDDLYYIQNYSFWLDLRILLRTVVVVLRGHGAY